MEFTKHSQRNLSVIENFILHYAHGKEPQSSEMNKSAREYISEDHVDGEDSEEAQNERDGTITIPVVSCKTEWDLGGQFEHGTLSFHSTISVAKSWAKDACVASGIFETEDMDSEFVDLMKSNLISIEQINININTL